MKAKNKTYLINNDQTFRADKAERSNKQTNTRANKQQQHGFEYIFF